MEKRLNPISRLLHWLMALMIISTIFLGVFLANSYERDYPILLKFHKQIGVILFILVFIRLLVRPFARKPVKETQMPRIHKMAARGLHILFYIVILIMPIIGISMLIYGGYPVKLFGIDNIKPDLKLFTILHNLHGLIGWGFFVLILAHIFMGLYHGLIKQDGTLRKMWFGKLN